MGASSGGTRARSSSCTGMDSSAEEAKRLAPLSSLLIRSISP